LRTSRNIKKVIEFEDVVDEFFSVQKQLQDKMRDFVKDIFNAADVNLMIDMKNNFLV